MALSRLGQGYLVGQQGGSLHCCFPYCISSGYKIRISVSRTVSQALFHLRFSAQQLLLVLSFLPYHLPPIPVYPLFVLCAQVLSGIRGWLLYIWGSLLGVPHWPSPLAPLTFIMTPSFWPHLTPIAFLVPLLWVEGGIFVASWQNLCKGPHQFSPREAQSQIGWLFYPAMEWKGKLQNSNRVWNSPWPNLLLALISPLPWVQGNEIFLVECWIWTMFA